MANSKQDLEDGDENGREIQELKGDLNLARRINGDFRVGVGGIVGRFRYKFGRIEILRERY